MSLRTYGLQATVDYAVQYTGFDFELDNSSSHDVNQVFISRGIAFRQAQDDMCHEKMPAMSEKKLCFLTELCDMFLHLYLFHNSSIGLGGQKNE
jgi:hypothetical protein